MMFNQCQRLADDLIHLSEIILLGLTMVKFIIFMALINFNYDY